MMLDQFKQAEEHARRGRWSRWQERPLRYLKGLGISRIIYPLTSRRVAVETPVFSGDRMTVPLPSGLDVYLTGVKSHDSELRLARYLLGTLAPGQTILDIGAHIGYFTLLMARCTGPDGLVVAFEPSQNVLPYLRKNVAHLAQVRIEQAAVGTPGAQVMFHEYAPKYSEFNSYRPTHDAPLLSRRKITTIGLDAWCDQHDLRADLIKVDVEGAELDVIKGGRDMLTTRQPVVILEIRQDSFDVLYAPVIRLMTEYGYVAHRITKEGSLVHVDAIRQQLTVSGLESDNVVFTAPRAQESEFQGDDHGHGKEEQ